MAEKEKDFDNLLTMVTDIHKLLFPNNPTEVKRSLKDKFKAEILIKGVKKRVR